jgi:hypothetical protein
MVDAVRVFEPGFQVTNASGTPQSGAVLRFFAAGTSNTRTVYSDLGLSVSLGVTVTTNAAGRPAASAGAGAEVLVYTGTTPYKVTAETALGVALWSFDNVVGALDTSTFLTGSVTAETPVISKTGNYTILTTDQEKVINANPTGSTFTLTLPNATTAGDGWRIHIRHTGTANSVNIATVASQTINGATSWVLDGQYQGIVLVSDAANWHIDSTALGAESVTPYNLDITALPYGGGLLNGTISASVAASALTISILNYDGTAPSAAKPVRIAIRSATAANGDYAVLTLTSATTFVISSGSDLGALASVPFKLWLPAFNDGGTFRLGAVKCVSGVSTFPLGQFPIASSTAEGGAGGADSASVIYTGTAVSSKPYVVLGYLSFEAGLATPGTWNVGPTRIHLQGHGDPLPGQILQRQITQTGAVATGTTVTPYDDTIPAKTEGDEYMSKAIVITSAANILEMEAEFVGTQSNSGHTTVAFHQDAVTAALVAVTQYSDLAAHIQNIKIFWAQVAGTNSVAAGSSTTIALRAGPDGAFTVTFNGAAGARKFGGVCGSYISVTERMG